VSYPSEINPLAHGKLLRVRGLGVSYGPIAALHEVNFDVARGEIVGILGESGSGKSTLALSILGLLPKNAGVQGSVLFRNGKGIDEELLSFSERQWRKIRGARISMIFQEAGLALSPVMRVGEQVAEVLRAHGQKSREPVVTRLLKRVQLLDSERVYRAYPHQLSGGQLHRVAIAQALACNPEVVIADESTRSLDKTVEAEILNVLREVSREAGSSLLFITHNPALLEGFADRVIVMYAGRIVEEGAVGQVYQRPLHPYTRALLQLASPVLERSKYLAAIPGSLMDSMRVTRGCVFEPRCSARSEICVEGAPVAIEAEESHQVSCFNHGN